MIVQPAGLRINRGGAQTACNEHITALFELFRISVHKLGRVAQRAHDIGKGVPYIKLFHHLVAGTANKLDNHCHCPFDHIGVADGEWYALPFLIVADNKELARQGSRGQSWSLYLHQIYLRSEHPFFQNLIHTPCFARLRLY